MVNNLMDITLQSYGITMDVTSIRWDMVPLQLYAYPESSCPSFGIHVTKRRWHSWPRILQSISLIQTQGIYTHLICLTQSRPIKQKHHEKSMVRKSERNNNTKLFGY